uniref:Serine protease n=1 Tax=Amphilophus citrinellus TaxID=61819 RepID=A0A3Q0T3C6_AMPCI
GSLVWRGLLSDRTTEQQKGEKDRQPPLMKFSQKYTKEHNIYCDQPRTVLQAIKTLNQYKKEVTADEKVTADENIIIQMGTGDNESSIATHFPCTCIGDDEVLTILCKTEKVEAAQHDVKIYTRDKYSVFYIDKDGGKDTKTKQLFKNNAVKEFKYLRVYGEKGITVKEALKRDGRFIDKLFDDDFELTKNEKTVIECTQKVDKKEGISLKQAVKGTGSSIEREEVYKLLCEQFPRLKQWMESRFPGGSFQKSLNLRKESFGKIQQSFSEVQRVRELLQLAESVCLLEVHISDSSAVQGTGFVLFDNFVLTNAHLFKYWIDTKLPNWWESVNITAVFNFEKPKSDKKEVKAKVFVGNNELDYAILKLETEKVPAGLLKRFGPLPSDGEACIVGHPAGGVKKMDPTCIIEKEKREEAVNKNLEDYKECFITLCAINQAIKNDPYENIHVNYNTFMYHGASGSPVFDAHGRVFGLHTGGFFYGFPKAGESMIEYAFPLLTIFENFMGNLKKCGDEQLLERVEEEAKGNLFLENIIASVMGPKQSRPEESVELS